MIAVASWFLAMLVSLPLSHALGSFGRMMFGVPLPFTVSTFGAAFWLGLVIIIAFVASGAPASRAARLVVREALTYE
jgi:ABC-type lipoprotein release transport system permease subunit